MQSRTYTSTTISRGCAEFEPTHLVYTDVVSEDGTVLSTVKGECDGEYVNARWQTKYGTEFDLDTVERARLSSGWVRR